MNDTYTIEALGPAGDGIARHENGSAIFIPLTAPGDVVRASVRQDHEGNWRGQVEEIVTQGSVRQDAPCAHYGQCGGCALQHVSLEYYQNHKQQMVIQALEKVGLESPPVEAPILINAGTRRRAAFSFMKQGREIVIGFNGRRSHAVMDVPGCLVVMPDILNLVKRLAGPLADIVAAKKGSVFIQSVGGQLEVSITAKMNDGLAFHEALATMVRELGIARINGRAHERLVYDVLLESAPLIKNCGPLRVNLPPGTFLQPSDAGEKALVDLVMEMAGECTRMADLFSGCGTFAGPLSTKGSVTAYEAVNEPVQALSRAAASINGLQAHIRNLYLDPLSEKELKLFDCVVLDPPRAGAKEQCRTLASSDVKRIIYVSCNAQSFARDAKILHEGGYHIKRIQPVDQFTWSAHGEMVGLFERD